MQSSILDKTDTQTRIEILDLTPGSYEPSSDIAEMEVYRTPEAHSTQDLVFMHYNKVLTPAKVSGLTFALG